VGGLTSIRLHFVDRVDGNTPAVYWKLARFAGPFRKRRGWRLAAHQSGTARCVFVVVRRDPGDTHLGSRAKVARYSAGTRSRGP